MRGTEGQGQQNEEAEHGFHLGLKRNTQYYMNDFHLALKHNNKSLQRKQFSENGSTLLCAEKYTLYDNKKFALIGSDFGFKRSTQCVLMGTVCHKRISIM